MAHAFLCLQENVAVCDMHRVQYMVLSKQSPKSVLDKKKCILVILFAKSFTFSSSWYCPINYPNQRRMKNKHLILAILFTKNCTFSKSLFPVQSTFMKPITKISAEWKKIILFWPFYLHTTAIIHWLCKIITFSRPVKFLYLRFVNKMFQCQIFAELCVIKMDLFNSLDLQSNKKKPSNHEFTVCMWLFLTI